MEKEGASASRNRTKVNVVTLKDCTKEELIIIIERLQFYNFSNSYYVNRALLDVEEERENKRLAEAKRLSNYAAQKRQEYIALLAPYEGKRILDIPDSVIEKADATMKAAQAADSKWNKLMGITKRKAGRKGEQGDD